jgi:hypothetical protein
MAKLHYLCQNSTTFGQEELQSSVCSVHSDVDDLRLSENQFKLLCASDGGDLEGVVKTLVQSGEDVNSGDIDSDTPLCLASLKGHIKIVKFLVLSGNADINSSNRFGYTPLHLAAMVGHVKVVEFLVRNGADVTSEDNKGRTPIYWAKINGHTTVFAFLSIEEKFENARKANDHYFLRTSESKKVKEQVKSFEKQFEEENPIEIEIDDIKGISRILLFKGIIQIIGDANKNTFVNYMLGGKKYLCHHKPDYKYFGNRGKQKGNLFLRNIGPYEKDPDKPDSLSPVPEEMEKISRKSSSKKIAQAIRTSRTTGKLIDKDLFVVRNDELQDETGNKDGEVTYSVSDTGLF